MKVLIANATSIESGKTQGSEACLRFAFAVADGAALAGGGRGGGGSASAWSLWLKRQGLQCLVRRVDSKALPRARPRGQPGRREPVGCRRSTP